MLAAWLLQLSEDGYGLKKLAKDILGMDMISFEDVTKGRQFQELSPKEACDYACDDAIAALGLGEYCRPKLEALNLWKVLTDIEMPLCRILRDMETRGIAIDAEKLTLLHDELDIECKDLAAQWSRLPGLENVNINSPVQTRKALYFDLEVWPLTSLTPLSPTTKAPSTSDEAVGVALAACPQGSLGHEAARIMAAYNDVRKIASTYTLSLVEKARQYPDGRLHPNFLQHGTATGRLSSTYPNAQNIPVRNKRLAKRVLECFVAAPGNTFISADYSQIELRVLAHLSRDPMLTKAFREDLDLHEMTALGVGLGLSRDQGKTLNFAVVYGARGKKIAKSLGVSLPQANEILKKMDSFYAGIQGMRNQCSRVVRDRGYIRTLLGRIRYLPGINADDKLTRWSAERQAMNTPVQGGARDIMALGMIAFAKRDTLFTGAEPNGQIHDDLRVECPEADAKEVAHELAKAMEGAYPLSVPLKVDTHIGKTWADLK